MSDEKAIHAWTKAYHPSGLQVTLPVTKEPQDYGVLFARVGEIVAAGFLANAPGVEPGESKHPVGWVLKREKNNEDGSTTPIIDLYEDHDRMTWKVLSVYLNRDEDIKAFEDVSGFKVISMQTFPAQAAPERGKNAQSDRFIYRCTKPFAVILRPNPKHDADAAKATVAKGEIYSVPKKLFVRWDGPVGTKPSANGQPAADPVERFKKCMALIQQATKHTDCDKIVLQAEQVFTGPQLEQVKNSCYDRRVQIYQQDIGAAGAVELVEAIVAHASGAGLGDRMNAVHSAAATRNAELRAVQGSQQPVIEMEF